LLFFHTLHIEYLKHVAEKYEKRGFLRHQFALRVKKKIKEKQMIFQMINICAD